jgi:ketosteroid isomerase-like protein
MMANQTMATDPRTSQVVRFYETLSRQSLAELGTVYTNDARFIDPFNEVAGLEAIRAVFVHMFDGLDEPRFEILETITEGTQCFVSWNFHFRRHGRPGVWLIHGGSHLRFGADGRVALHRDHWDPAREIYERLPLLGMLLRWLRRSLSASR